MIAGTTALKWAFREGLIPQDPTAGLIRFSGKFKKRGVLTPTEAEAIFAVKWEDKRAFVASMVSCTTGLRSGEVLALRQSDIGDKVLFVRHSWCTMQGLKSPKSGDERKVPLLPEVKTVLQDLLKTNPYKVDDPFIFYGLLENIPVDPKFLLNGLKSACTLANVDTAARGVVFHSWRHYFAALMADKMTAEQVMRITGHASSLVFEGYADHVIDENLGAMGKAGDWKNPTSSSIWMPCG
jgi:integrase